MQFLEQRVAEMRTQLALSAADAAAGVPGDGAAQEAAARLAADEEEARAAGSRAASAPEADARGGTQTPIAGVAPARQTPAAILGVPSRPRPSPQRRASPVAFATAHQSGGSDLDRLVASYSNWHGLAAEQAKASELAREWDGRPALTYPPLSHYSPFGGGR